MSDKYYVTDANDGTDLIIGLRSMGIEVWFTKYDRPIDLTVGATEQAIRYIHEGNVVALNELLQSKEDNDNRL
jgi:hypothetical protein